MVLVLVVGSAVQKKRGQQRGDTRERQQQSKKQLHRLTVAHSLLLMCIHFVFPGDKMES